MERSKKVPKERNAGIVSVISKLQPKTHFMSVKSCETTGLIVLHQRFMILCGIRGVQNFGRRNLVENELHNPPKPKATTITSTDPNFDYECHPLAVAGLTRAYFLPRLPES